ncbi:MAG: ABC transporter [Sphingomonadales bacterium 12-68-11]|nr:MAG: ABC transporter [Sphingomonadales bacterium 12-68-11]
MPIRAGLAAMLALALAGCISLGPKVPETLLTLTPERTVAVGATSAGQPSSALVVLEPASAQRLAVVRVPVQVDAASVAYLQDAVWVERPARLFQHLLSETIRARGGRLVVGDGEVEYAAATQLGGQLMEMGYDAPSGSVIVRYDAVLQMPGGEVRTRRFESTVSGVAAEAAAVGPALNQAANRVAAEVAEWVG